MMALSHELYQKWVAPIEGMGEILGIAVDDSGSFIMWAFDYASQECVGVLVIPSRESGRIVTCENADSMYREVCIGQEYCNDNPYIDGKI